jgi:hypothetical protein
MLKDYLLRSSVIYIIIFCTFLHALISLNKNKLMYRYVMMILTVFVLNEVISTCSVAYSFTFKINSTITTFVHNVLWLLIIRDSVRFPRIVNGLLIAFITFSLCDLFFIEGWKLFNCYSFILGSFIYLILFLVESFYQLKQENFPYFFSNKFILLMVPVLFFIGLTFMFGFKSRSVNTTLLFGKFELYRVIIIAVNIVYYSLLNIYIYREKKKLYEF